MDSLGSVTRCIRDLENGQRREEAARELWERFFEDLARYALKKLKLMHAALSVADQEDVATRAFTKVCRGIERGQLKPTDRDGLQKLLLWSARGEAINQVNRLPGDPGGGREWAGSDPSGSDRVERDGGLELVPGPGLPPELLVLAEEGCRRLLDRLGDDLLRRIALWKLLGHTNEEIARGLGCSLAKVERKLGKIRDAWAEVAPEGPPRPGPRSTSGVDVADDLGGTTTILRGLSGRS